MFLPMLQDRRTRVNLKRLNFVSLDELLSNSDIVTCHCPLTPETEGLINEDTISKMKNNVIFINTSRGPVVDETALADALNNDKNSSSRT